MIEFFRGVLMALPSLLIDKRPGEITIKRLDSKTVEIQVTVGTQHITLKGHPDELQKQLTTLIGNH